MQREARADLEYGIRTNLFGILLILCIIIYISTFVINSKPKAQPFNLHWIRITGIVTKIQPISLHPVCNFVLLQYTGDTFRKECERM